MRVELATLTVMTGRLSAAKQRFLLRWAAPHRAELARNSELARKGLPHEPIDPTLDGEED